MHEHPYLRTQRRRASFPDEGDYGWGDEATGDEPLRDFVRAGQRKGTPTEETLDGYVLAPHDLATWPPGTTGEVGVGIVEALVVAPDAEAPVLHVDEAVAIAGRGLEGDRYAAGAGTFASGRPGSALTLVDAAVLDTFDRHVDHRRNVVVRGTDLNALVGRDFMLGEVRCRGRRLCEPCAHLDRLNGGGVLRPLVHRGGLRADVIRDGTVRVGDRLTPV